MDNTVVAQFRHNSIGTLSHTIHYSYSGCSEFGWRADHESTPQPEVA